METREALLRKIEGLLKLAEDSPEDHECQSALLKVRSLMSQYNLTMEEVTVVSKAEVNEVESGTFTTRYTLWRMHLATLLANNHRCSLLVRRYRGLQTRGIAFVGEGEDPSILREIYNSTVHYLDHVTEEIRNEYRNCSPDEQYSYSDSYVKGFIAGLRDSYREQTTISTEMGLMVVLPPSVEEYMESFKSVSLSTSKVSLMSRQHYSAGYEKGVHYNDLETITEG